MESSMRRFVLYRVKDVSGISGTGNVAEGVIFTDGKVALRWLTRYRSTALYDTIADVLNIHGHDGSTEVRYADGHP